MDRELLRQALTKFFAGLVLTALLVFVPAGTLRYPGGLLLMAVLFVPMFIAGLVMMKWAPDLLRRRLNAKEEQLVQKGVIALSGLMFVACFVLGGLSFRLSWLTLPWGVQLAAAAVFLVERPQVGDPVALFDQVRLDIFLQLKRHGFRSDDQVHFLSSLCIKEYPLLYCSPN